MNPSTHMVPVLRSGSQILIEALERNGVKQIFGYPCTMRWLVQV